MMGLRKVLWSLRHPLSSPPDAEQRGSPYWFGRGGGFVPSGYVPPPEDEEGIEFTYTGSNLITSDRGFSVDLEAPSAIRYQESAKTMEISAEWLSSPAETIAVRRRDVRVWDGSAEEELDVTARARIVENIRRALLSKGWTLQVEE